MKATTIILSATLAMAAAAPAFAEMRTSVPQRSNQPMAQKAAAATNGVASGADAYRPTGFLGIQRAQILGNGNAVMGLNGLNLNWGFGNNMELGFNTGLNLSTAPSFALPIGVSAKMLMADTKALSMAVMGAVNTSIANPFTLNGGIYLPISVWDLGPGNLHVMPALNLGVVPFNFGLGNLGVSLGYELPIMNNWSMHIVDNFSTGGNTLTLGNRVALTPNLTADIGSISLNGSTLNINLINMNAYFGGSTSFLTKAWGL